MTPVIVVFGAVAVALIGRGVFDHVRLRRSGYRPWRSAPLAGGSHRFLTGASATFRGAGAAFPVKLSGPSVVMTLDTDWAHLHGTGGLIDVWIPREQVTGIKTVRLTGATAVRFVSAGGEYDGVLSHSFSPQPLLAAFRAYGWPLEDQ
jgi:hypothetical protein